MAVYFHQLLAGRDFAKNHVFASQMANFVYLVGDAKTRECLIVDPAWDVRGLLRVVQKDDMKLRGVLVTHYHPDHIGGEIFGYNIAGLGELLADVPVPVHVNTREAEGVQRLTGLSASDVVPHDAGDRVKVGDVEVTLIHTPGHTPGSQCFLVGSTLISGDTLFIGGCGRVDLPGGDPEQMYYSLTQVLARLPDETLLYPGHNYSSNPFSTIGEEKATNYSMRMKNLDDWMHLMGRG